MMHDHTDRVSVLIVSQHLYNTSPLCKEILIKRQAVKLSWQTRK